MRRVVFCGELWRSSHAKPSARQNVKAGTFPQPYCNLKPPSAYCSAYMARRKEAAPVPDTIANPDWGGILEAAMKAEGGSLGHYNRLYTYSMGNLAFLLYQGVTPQPVANYQRWQEVGRHVKRGAKAFYILRPINVKLDELDDEGNPKTITRFKPVKSVFRLQDTEGEPLPELELPEWSRERMLGNLAIELASDFPTYNGNVQGLSEGRTIYINPVAKYPEKTFFHETAHIQAGHTAGDYMEYLAHRGVYEAEAEGTAHLVMNELKLLHEEMRLSSGAYLRTWLNGKPIPPTSIRRIFKTTDEILRAGRNQLDVD